MGLAMGDRVERPDGPAAPLRESLTGTIIKIETRHGLPVYPVKWVDGSQTVSDDTFIIEADLS